MTAKTSLRCFILTRGDFRRVLDENRVVERKVMEALAERLLSYTADAEALVSSIAGPTRRAMTKTLLRRSCTDERISWGL